MPHAGVAAPKGCTNFKLRQLTRRVSQRYDRVVAASGLKTTQYSLLSQIEHLGPARPSDLAAAMALDNSTLTRTLQSLIANGWAEIGPGEDGRSRLVAITAEGHAKRSEAQREWKRAQLALNERLGAARVAELHALLDDCLATLSEPELETSDA